MKNTKHYQLLAAVGIALCIGSASASAQITDYSTDFTSVDGFGEGLTPNGVDGWVTRNAPQATTDNVGTYGAALFNANGPSMAQNGAGGSFAVGDSVTLTSTIFYNGTFSGNADFNFGLSNVGTDASANRAGILFRRQASGVLQIIPTSLGGSEDGANVSNAGTAVAGQANGLTLSVTVAKTATANTFDVSYVFGAFNDTFQAVNATLYGAANVYGTMDFNGTAGQLSADSYSQTVTPVPEPTSFALAGFGLATLLIFRRKH